MSDRPDSVVIVGAGPWGLASASALAAAGRAVTILDDGVPSAGHVAAGMLGPWSESEPGRERFSADLLRAEAAWPPFAADLCAEGDDPGYHACGTIHVAAGREQIAPLRRRADQLTASGAEASWYGGGALREIDPGVGPAVGGGLHLPGEHQVDPRRLIAALAARAERHGARRVRRAAARIVHAEGRAVAVEDADGVRHAGHIVLAAGWRSGELSSRVPLRGVKGQILRLEVVPGGDLPCRHVVRAGDVYVVPRPSGEVVIGATMEERTDRDALAGDIHGLLDEALRAVPGLSELRLVEAAAGVRPAPADGAPAVGRDADGVIWATGGFRHGILLTPLIGPTVCAAVAGSADPPAGWDPRRFDAARAPEVAPV